MGANCQTAPAQRCRRKGANMPAEPVELLSKTQPFSLLPLPVLEDTASKLSLMTFSQGTVLALQGRTTLDYVYLIRSGSLDLFFESNGRKTLQGALGPGDIFGAISILMNSGLSIRSLAVMEDAALYLMPRKVFLDLCDRHAFILDHFNRAFSQRMQNEPYAMAIAATQVTHFLSRIPPCSFLPEEELRALAPNTSSVFFPKGAVVFVQGESR
ncbi:MAG: cyclic nucleotide-binding domain-containing protein, partial [Syntrophobacterales bacterium]